MKKLKGTNNSSLSEIFKERTLYEFFAFYPMGQVVARDPMGIKNYWRFENILYGKVDKSMTVITPNKDLLVTIPNQEKIFYTLPTIDTSFAQFQNAFKIPSQSGRLASDNYLRSPEIYRAYEDAAESYNEDLTSFLDIYNKKLLSTPQGDKITNIKDYARDFFNLILTSPEAINITRTSHTLSPKVSAINSGLCIEIADLNPSKNSDKQFFVESPNFDFYKQTAINSGFLIDKNIPWRLNFDLSSPVNSSKISAGIFSSDPASAYLSDNFENVYLKDLDYLISMVIVGYNTLVSQKKYYMEGRCKFLRIKVDKEEVLKTILPEYYWIKRYAQIRNKECGLIYDAPELKKIIDNANDISSGKLEYISSKFRLPYVFEGSTVYQELKKYYLEKNNISLDNFSEHVKLIIKNSINKIY